MELKCRFFTWLLQQNKLWTADRITTHGGQTNPICQLCKSQPETAFHIMARRLLLLQNRLAAAPGMDWRQHCPVADK
jgi:hypothetical protein